MELIHSDIPPIKTLNSSLFEHFKKNIKESDKLKIASGYISTDSLTELRKMIELNNGPSLELIIGMHHFEGFTQVQFESAAYLDDFLVTSNLGQVFVCKSFKFHGKIYLFEKQNKIFSTVIGSSNLHNVLDNTRRVFEIDVESSQSQICKQTDSLFQQLANKACDPFAIYKSSPHIIDQKNKLLNGDHNVDYIEEREYLKLYNENPQALKFNISLKSDSATKSNLNIYFGKGRKTKSGFILPRPWYEVELIVSKKITSLPGYPRGEVFSVITDDGWRFLCYTSGTDFKNFRSKDDLRTLGRWIKGRLESSGALKIGGLVTSEVFEKYGRNNLELISTRNPDVWLLNFSNK